VIPWAKLIVELWADRAENNALPMAGSLKNFKRPRPEYPFLWWMSQGSSAWTVHAVLCETTGIHGLGFLSLLWGGKVSHPRTAHGSGKKIQAERSVSTNSNSDVIDDHTAQYPQEITVKAIP
jgi:hypothetical protein